MSIDCDKLFKYIDGELVSKEKEDFEKEIDQNAELNSMLADIKQNDYLLKNLSKTSTSSNFVVNVNKKIAKPIAAFTLKKANSTSAAFQCSMANRLPIATSITKANFPCMKSE